MSGALKTIGKVAGLVAAVALIGSGIGSALGGTMMFTALGTSISAATIATVAGAVSALAMSVSQMTAKKPAAQGQIDRRIFGANSPLPYPMGRTSTPGVQVHDTAWGGKISKVWNPYRFLPIVLACAGPANALEAVKLDQSAVSFSGAAATGYYAGFLYKDDQLGQSPESSALTAASGWGSPPGWGSDYKLSGFAAVALSFKFDKEGKVFAQGLPPISFVGQWVSVYDPRLDSTYPGGSGPHRIDDETTWEYSANPALHAIAYAYGRRQNDKLIFGVGMDAADIRLAQYVALANVCDANGWTVGGTIYEPGDKWNNLKLILETAAAEPMLLSDGTLGVKFQAPRISLGNIARGDIKGDQVEIARGRTWRERLNIIVPKFRSEANDWTYVQATAQRVEDFVTADGEEKEQEIQYDLIQSGDQAAEIALYDLYQRREPGPFSLTLGPAFKHYQPGDTLTLLAETDLWDEGADIDLVILRKAIDPMTGLVTLECEGEDPAKHAAVLGATAAPPPAVTIPTAEDRDFAFGFNSGLGGAVPLKQVGAEFPITPDDNSIAVAAFTAETMDGRTIAFPAGAPAVGSLASDTKYGLFWNPATATWSAAAYPAAAEWQDGDLIFAGWATTSNGGVFPTPTPPPGGWGGSGPYPQEN